MNEYQKELQRLLKISTLTPATYTPSHEVKTGKHAAVFVGGEAFMLLGPSDDLQSIMQAKAFANSSMFRSVIKTIGLEGDIDYGTSRGTDIHWFPEHVSIADSKSGHVEQGADQGVLMAIQVGPTQSRGVAVLLSTVTDLARILDPNVPELDDGLRLSALAKKCA